jgi:type I restriction enzyme, S subunit
MSWTEHSLGEFIKIKHGFAFKSEFFSDDGEYVLLTPGNFHESGGFRRRPKKDRYFVGDFPESYILKPNDLIVAMTEQGQGLLGSSAWIPNEEQYLHNQRLGLIDEIDEEKIDKRFLFYLFNTYSVRSQISGSATGTKVKHTAPERIYRVRVNVPEIEDQQKIARIVTVYDDLIENNRRRIALLEEAAQQLYKEWFVRFRFPGHEHVKIIDGVPEGWDKKPFSKLADFLNGFAFKPYHLGEEGYPVVKIPELKGGVTPKTPRNSGLDVPEKYHLTDGDLLFSWSGTLAVNQWSGGPALLNQHLFKVATKGDVSNAFLMTALREAMQLFLNETTGATMKHIRRSALDKVCAFVPPPSLLEEYEEIVENSYQQILCLNRQINKLTQARDILFPKLMSGEIAV